LMAKVRYRSSRMDSAKAIASRRKLSYFDLSRTKEDRSQMTFT
jgi:hypothetical protein